MGRHFFSWTIHSWTTPPDHQTTHQTNIDQRYLKPHSTRSLMQRPGSTRASSRAVVNTNFLLNTVHGIGSHNRREEVEDCWRQRRLEQQDDKPRTRLSNVTGDRQRELPYQKEALEEAAASVDGTRTFWAEQKQRAMAATGTASPMEGALMSTMQTGTSVERSENNTKLGKVACRDSSSSVGAELLADEKERRHKKDDKKDKKNKTHKKKSKYSKKGKRKRGDQDARDADNNKVEESQRQENLESDVGGAKRKKPKKHKEQKKYHNANRKREN